MSYVSNAILSFAYADEATECAVLAAGYTRINDDAVGGPKWWEADTYLRTYNYTALDDIADEARACITGACWAPVLIVHDENDEDEVHIWVGLTLRQVQP